MDPRPSPLMIFDPESGTIVTLLGDQIHEYVAVLERALFEIAHRGDAWSQRRAIAAMEGA